jgi:hypothetical protein
MIPFVRQSLGLLSGLAFVACIAIYGASFVGLTLDGLHLWPFAITLGIFALMIPMCVIEYESMAQRTFFWKGFADDKPNWVVPTIKGLGILYLIHFILFLALSHAASPDIVNGQFVLDDHGTIKRMLTEREYLRLKGDELRLFATGWISFYSVTTAYWRFPSKLPLPQAGLKP